LRIGLDDAEINEKYFSNLGGLSKHSRDQGFGIGFIYRLDTSKTNNVNFSLSGQLTTIRSRYRYEAYTYTKFIDNQPVKVGVTPAVLEGSYLTSGSRISLLIEFNFLRHFFFYFDPAIHLSRKREHGEISDLEVNMDNNRFMGLGARF
jgi:hypothetical protein